MTRRFLLQSTLVGVPGGVVLLKNSGAGPNKAELANIHGKIQFVESFPDYKVKIVQSFADLHVQRVSSFPDKPGKWKIVTSFPDFKIQIVNSFPDFTIKYVDSFPGVQS
ncbi:MAG: hypothetical protein MI807_01580 [Verrucomicrobiales bacterium]|nr:hypothetical protein [Verrucomicrobiales bacterium]